MAGGATAGRVDALGVTGVGLGALTVPEALTALAAGAGDAAAGGEAGGTETAARGAGALADSVSRFRRSSGGSNKNVYSRTNLPVAQLS